MVPLYTRNRELCLDPWVRKGWRIRALLFSVSGLRAWASGARLWLGLGSDKDNQRLAGASDARLWLGWAKA